MNETDIKEWLTLANHDIDTAELLVKKQGHADMIIYHIHQATEKLFKALLLKAGKTLEKTHFLDKLLAQLIVAYPVLEGIKDEVLEINLYLPKLRYPSGDKIEFKEAAVILEKFGKVRKLIYKLI